MCGGLYNREMTDFSVFSDEQLIESNSMTELFSRYVPMVFSMARKYSASADYEELVSDGMQALISAVSEYDSEKGGFKAFAAVCVANRMKNTVNKAERRAAKMSDEEMELPPDTAPSPEERVISRETSEELYRLILKELTPLEKACIDGVVMGLSYAEIAKKIGTDKKAVNNAVSRARAKLRKHYSDLI